MTTRTGAYMNDAGSSSEYRELRVYDGPFPAPDQIISCDPAAPPFPKESWTQHMRPGEFAVRCKDPQTRLPRAANGQHVGSTEVCRVFGHLEAARADARRIVGAQPGLVCIVYDCTGSRVDQVPSRKALLRDMLMVWVPVVLAVPALLALGPWLLSRAIAFGWQLAIGKSLGVPSWAWSIALGLEAGAAAQPAEGVPAKSQAGHHKMRLSYPRAQFGKW